MKDDLIINGKHIVPFEDKEFQCNCFYEHDKETAYLKGNLQATKSHLEDMRTLVFVEKNRVIKEVKE